MAEQGIHYRHGGKLTHTGCEILPNGKDIEHIVIEKVELKEAEEVGGRREQNIWIATFAPNPYTKLPMVLNATNRKRLSKLAKTPYINLIKNFPVRLTQEECRDAQDGGTTWGLRISKIPAVAPKAMPQNQQPTTTQAPSVTQKEKQELTSKHPDWAKAIDYIAGGATIEQLEVRYVISEKIAQEIRELASLRRPE